MSSSIFNLFRGNNNIGVGDFFSRMNEFNSFKNSFQGNPQEAAQKLLQSGQMSQEQFQQYAQLANLIRPLLK